MASDPSRVTLAGDIAVGATSPGRATASATIVPVLAAVSLCHLLNDLMQSLLPAAFPVLHRDFRVRAFRDALRLLEGPAGESQTRVERIQHLLSDPTTEPLEKLDTKSARGAYDRWQLGVA